MIGTFWNLCRACPAKPVDKLHSEYRSTYRWHEYTGPRPHQDEVIRGQPPPSSGPGPAPEPEAPRLRPPGGARRVAYEDHLRPDAPDNSEPILPRRRKNPLLAYRCHEVLGLTAAASEDCLDTARSDRFRSRSTPRKAAKMVAAGAGEASSQLPAAGLPTERRVHSEQRRQFGRGGVPAPAPTPAAAAAAAVRMEAAAAVRTEAAVQGAMFAASRPAAGKASGQEQTASMAAPRKSLSMGALRAQQQRSRVTNQDRMDDAAESEPLMASQDHGDDGGEEKIREDNISKEDKPRQRKEFKTEYKKKFRPFSQYEYVEGRFLKRKEDEVQQDSDQTDGHNQKPWYTEVIELRKKAGEYKHRGWGTELVPEHISELYSKQLLLWEQVSRRSSLSALSLAAVATPRSISKEEKEQENSRRTSPTKAASLGRPRPHTAQPKLPGVHERSKSEKARKTEKADDNKKEARTSRKQEFPLRHHLERTTGAGRSQSLGPGGAPETRSPKRSPRAPPAPTKTNGTPSETQRRPRPTTLNTTAPSRSKSRTSAPSKGEAQGTVNKSQPSTGRAASKGDDHKAVPPRARARPASGEEAEEDEPEVDLEPIVKSPPEPTRVKSPEQIIMRSPEPVNWTVPLDTGKTFTVTQNVPDGERPHGTPSPAPPAPASKESAAPKPAPRKPDPSASATSKGSASSSPAKGVTAAAPPTATPAPPSSSVRPEPRTTAAKSDPMTTSTLGSLGDSSKPPVKEAPKVAPKAGSTSEPKSDPKTSSTMGSYSGSSIPKTDSMSTSIMGSSLGDSSFKTDPMTASTTGSIAGSSLKSDPMAMSMSGSSFGGSSLKSDPMATSMMGSSFGGSSIKSDPMASSMMGSSMSSSYAPSDPMVSSMMGSSIGSSKDPMSMPTIGSSSAKDPMTTSVMGSLSGKSDPMTSSMIGSLNGMDKTSAASGGTTGSSQSGTLKCLEDPSFVFDKGSAAPPPPAPRVQIPPASGGGTGGGAGYRVLEAPTPPPAQNPSQPPLASANLDNARDRFDKFWGKEKEGQL